MSPPPSPAAASTAARLCTRREQRAGKEGGCQYHHRSSCSHESSFRWAGAINDHRTSCPTSYRCRTSNRQREISKTVIGAADCAVITAEKDDAGQRAGSAAVSRSGANAFLGPVRHSWIRFPSILNSAPREDVDRQARTSVRYGLSGESGRITTLRVEASSECTAIWGISVIPRFAATI